MNSSQFSFFATKADLIDSTRAIERNYEIRYVEMGLFEYSVLRSYESFEQIPGIGFTDSLGSPTLDSRLMIVAKGVDVVIREVPQRKGGTRYAVDMMSNRDSFELSPAGIFTGSPKILILGRAATFGEADFSKELYKFFLSQVKRHFVKVGWVYVGKEAAEYCDEGWRLTRDSRLPASEDLVKS